MIKIESILRLGKGTAIVENCPEKIKCAATEPITMAATITIIDSPEGSLTSLDNDDKYHDLFPHDEDTERLQFIDLIRRMATAVIKTL